MLLFEWDPKKAKINLETHGQDILEEYDFSNAVQGKYAKRYAQGTNVVVIEPDVAKIFPDHDSVNQALRSLADIIKRQKKVA